MIYKRTISFLLFFIFSVSLFAHQTGLSYIEITQNKDNTLHVTYKKPLEDASATPIFIHYPSTCKTLQVSQKQFDNGFIIQDFTLWCGKDGMKDSRIWVEGLVRNDKGVLVKYTSKDFEQKALLRSTTPFVKITKQNSTLEYMKEYISLGISHILSGYDHLLFILSMVLLAKNMKVLLLAVTGFTVAHSITLALAVFDLITIPVRFVESMIALSIIFLARELLITKYTLTKKHLEYIAFIFGFLHGMGFSTALKEIGLPQEDIAVSLFSFNIGIELGQILFILISLTILIPLYKLIPKQKVSRYLAYFIGVTASFWFIERVAGF
ncbi:MAG: HupE/UreJ family protein [Epsilonproteobacteria bacterium]|nr:HupE/UreJ family protein [Campylobacterota bacterium]